MLISSSSPMPTRKPKAATNVPSVDGEEDLGGQVAAEQQAEPARRLQPAYGVARPRRRAA